ncbi:MAG TPA: hypothetical protein VGO30_09430 [Mycobacterium sp.]|jgi:hypothetical protein|nr:hypothetical protein [Mycobacterium sp.]
MTEPQDSHSSTRPISVAELLAKNGTIGAPPVGGRRRRRRGNSDSVTVAELTGEIPIVTDTTDEVEESVAPDDVDDVEDAAPLDEPIAPAPTNGVVHAPEPVPAEADYAAHLEQRDAEPAPVEFTPPPRRHHVAPRTGFAAPAGGAEQMSPDPLVDDDESDDHLTLLDIDDVDDAESSSYDVEPAGAEAPSGVLPSYLRSSGDTLFGGQSVADDLARRGRQPGPEDIDLGDEDDGFVDASPAEAREQRGSSFLRGVWVVAQCILAVAFGAGLFVAFDQLWKWNSIVALVLGVLVILGLVVGVRVVRKTEDIGSTLIAVAVGAMVTIGPLALLQAH